MNAYPQAYLDYLIYFQAQRDYFECHEVLEEYWKNHPEDPHRMAYVGPIQLAVGLYHQRRGNMAGAVKMLQGAWNRLHEESMIFLGLEPIALKQAITDRITRLQAGASVYEDLDLPIEDSELVQQCQQECLERGLIWSSPSDPHNEQLIHKHMLRDRSEVIDERNLQIRKRQQQKDVSL